MSFKRVVIGSKVAALNRESKITKFEKRFKLMKEKWRKIFKLFFFFLFKHLNSPEPMRGNQLPVSATSGLYYKHMTIVKYDSSVVSKWSFKLIDDTSVIIYDRNMFIIQATGGSMGHRYVLKLLWSKKSQNCK